jgi:Cu-Zn family superoxide dismutase
MKYHTPLLLVLAALNAAGRPEQKPASPPSTTALVTVRSSDGTTLGQLRLEPTPTGIHLTGTLTGLTPGSHGIHFHQIGRCDPPDFASAGAHLNPEAKHHGLENPEGPHAGDLPNVTAAADGQAVVDLVTPRVTLGSGGPNDLLDADGTALVIHASADDQKSDPAGNSGARIACGVVEKG